MKKRTIQFALVFLLTYCISSAKEDRTSLSLQATYGIPTYTKYNEASTGFGGCATLMYKVQESVFLTAHVGYMSFGTRYPDVHDDYNLRMIPILIGARYHLNNEGVIPFIGLDAGVYIAHKSYELSLPQGKLDITNIARDFGFAPTLGVMIPVGPIRIDFSAKYNAVLFKATEYLGLNLGVIFHCKTIQFNNLCKNIFVL